MPMIHGRPHDQRMADDHKYEKVPKQNQHELREKFEDEFSNALLVTICIALAVILIGFSMWAGLPRVE